MKNKKDRLEITEYIENISECISGEILDIVNYLQSLTKEYSNYIKLYIAMENDCYECGGYNYKLMGVRLETDGEYNFRMKKIKRAETYRKKSAVTKRLKKEESEKNQLKKLLAKYGNIT